MKKIIIIFLGLAICTSSLMAQGNFSDFIGQVVNFTSVNFPDRQIMVKDNLGVLDPPPAGSNLNSFKVVAALNGKVGLVSLESVAFPGHYLRHEFEIIKLHQPNGSQLFKDDASFQPMAPLFPTPGAFSLQASNFPNWYIRHTAFKLMIFELKSNIPPSERDIFNKDATFVVKPKIALISSDPDPIDEGIWFVIQNKNDVDKDLEIPAKRMAIKTNGTDKLVMAAIPLTGDFDEFLWRTVAFNGALKLVNKKYGMGYAMDCSQQSPSIGPIGAYSGQSWVFERSNLASHGSNVYTMSNQFITNSKAVQYADGALTVVAKNAGDTRQYWVFQPIDLVAGYKIPVIATHGYDRRLSLPFGYQLVASNNVSDWAMLNAHLIYKNMLGALNSDNKQKIQNNTTSKKIVVMISKNDPDEVNSTTPYLYPTYTTEQIKKTRGGVSKGIIVISEEVMNTPNGPKDKLYREFDQVVHEMAHEIDGSCALNARGNSLAKPLAEDIKSEWFPWTVQTWFNSSQANGPKLDRTTLTPADQAHLSTVFNASNTWLPPRWLRNR